MKMRNNVPNIPCDQPPSAAPSQLLLLARELFRDSAAFRDRAAAHNSRWQRNAAIYQAFCPVPLYTSDLQLTPEMRQQYERFLPVAEFCESLGPALSALLPDASWLPECLRTCDFDGIDQLWRLLPVRLRGCVTFVGLDAWQELLLRLVSPERFGTTAGRYPQQLAQLRQLPTGRLLDVGCGTGEGTLELAALGFDCVGLTNEPLEAWLAQQQGGKRASYLAADALSLPFRVAFDVVTCNGLIGGPYLSRPAAYAKVWEEFERVLRSGGVLLVSDCFHGGRRLARNVFAESAPGTMTVLLNQDDCLMVQRS